MQTFHQYCDDKGATIVVMKSKAGKIFGGFTRQTWESLGGQLKEDEKAFIFSLDLLKVYRVAAPSKAVYCH